MRDDASKTEAGPPLITPSDPGWSKEYHTAVVTTLRAAWAGWEGHEGEENELLCLDRLSAISAALQASELGLIRLRLGQIASSLEALVDLADGFTTLDQANQREDLQEIAKALNRLHTQAHDHFQQS